MTIGIDISPLQSGHKIRGVGFYLTYLKRSLLDYCPEHTYIFFSQKEPLTQDVDLVHYPYFDPFFLTLPLNSSQKRVVTVHDLTPLVFPKHFPAGIKGSLKWQIQKHNLQKSDAIIVDSVASRQDVIRLAHIPKEHVHVAYLAAADEFQKKEKGKWREAIIEKYKLPEKFVLYVGDVTWNKNLPRLVQAIQELNVTLVMVGKTLAEKSFDASNPWNADLASVHKLIANDKRFIRLGFIPTEDVVDLYNAATVFTMPSTYEGFGLPVIEAMQSGAPVVTTKEGSLPEVAGDAAYYVDGYDISSMANGIGEVFYNATLQKELSAKGVKQALTFSWKKTAQETVKVYEKVLSK